MRTGAFVAPFHYLGENPTLDIERDIELIKHLDRLNYHEAWIGEHHSGGVETIASPELFIAVAAERTRRIRLGTGVLSLPYHHPFIVADRMVLLDHLTRGRAMFGVGPGALVHDAYKLGIIAEEQRPAMDAALSAIIDLFDGKMVSVDNKWFTLREARLQLPCYTHPRMEMVVATSVTPSGALAAGKHGVGMLSIGGTTPEDIQRHARNWEIYSEQCAKYDKTPNRDTWRMVGLFHIAPTREEAIRNVQYNLRSYANYYRDVANFPIVPPGIGDDILSYLMESGKACIGTPDDAVSYIQRIVDATGGFGCLCELTHNWADWPDTLRHHELMARFVHPHFQKSRDLRNASYQHGMEHQQAFLAETAAARQKFTDQYLMSKTGRPS